MATINNYFMNDLELKYLDLMRPWSASEMMGRLRGIKHIVLDMDGTIYHGNTLFPFTIPFLNTLKELGIAYSFLTNNPSKNTADYQKHLLKMGIPATPDEIYTSTHATIKYLQINYPGVSRLFILGTTSMIKEFEEAGFVSTADDPDDIPDAVVIGFDSTLVYPRLSRAAWWISKGLFYLATNPDLVCPTDEQTILLDCGSICASLERATNRVPDIIIGKPDARMLEGILLRHSLNSSQLAIVGDRIYTDLRMAVNTHALGVLVLSGETDIEMLIASGMQPDIIVNNISDFGQMLIEAKNNK